MKVLLIVLIGALPAGLFAQGQLGDFPKPAKRNANLFEDTTGVLERGGGSDDTGHELGDISAGGSAGFAFDEFGFYATGEMDFWIARFFSVGPLVQVTAGNDFIVVLGGGPKFTFDFGDNDFNNLVKPYVHLGPGLALVNAGHRHSHGRHHGHHTHFGAGLAVLFGIGVDFYIWDNLSLGTGFIWNWLVTEPADERFFFGWKVIEAKFHF